ncbi:CHASE domain-containing protein [Aquamicrobium segne]|uniref:histidine kinase n=1 Tax=Aquamicrobium segne TaxID=469547 RepID=A0ABW0H1U5_9HYPH
MKRLFPLLTFLAIALISLAMAGFAYFGSQEAARIKFEAIVDDAISRIETRLDLHLTLLKTTQAFLDTHENRVSQPQFQAFIAALDMKVNFPGLRGLGTLRLARTGDEEQIRSLIHQEQGLEREIYPETDQQWRAPVVIFEPRKPSSDMLIGYDMFSDPIRRQAMEMAMSDDALHATAPLMLGENAGVDPFAGFVVFVRLKNARPFAATQTPPPLTDGFLYAGFRSDELFNSALLRMPLLPVHVTIYDSQTGEEKPMFNSATPAITMGNLVDTRYMNVADRQWALKFEPTVAFSPPSSPVIPVMLGLFGLLSAVAIALVSRYRERAYDAAEKLHETAEKSLLEKDLMLQEMKHRIKNLISRILAISRQTASRAADVNEFSESFTARLQAMAASQDMLTRSRWQKVDLMELLRIELEQVFGNDLQPGLLNGPQVLLDEAATQALGLTFHELATNALKYGKASNSIDALKVDWRVEGQHRKRMLILNWRESEQENLQKPESIGFGTKLIDVNITRELGGSISRRFLPSGLQVKIRIPLK